MRAKGTHLGPLRGDLGESRGGILRTAVDKVECEVGHVQPRRHWVPHLHQLALRTFQTPGGKPVPLFQKNKYLCY